jgi:hypothetical protein
MTPASVAPGVSVVGFIRAYFASISAASAAFNKENDADSCFAVQAASVIAIRDGAPILSNEAPVSALVDLRKRRRETELTFDIAATFLLLLRTS